MWISKDICESQEDIRQIDNALRNIEITIFDIFDKITNYRLNIQV